MSNGPDGAGRDRPNVLWLTTNFAPQLGGVQTYVGLVVAALSETCDLTLLTDPEQGPSGPCSYRHLTVPQLRSTTTQRAAEAVTRRIERIVEDLRPDVVHLATAGLAVYAARLSRYASVVASVHGNDLTCPWLDWPGDIRAPMIEGLKACKRLFVLSDHVAALVRDAVPDMDIVKTPAVCNAAVFYPEPVDRRQLETAYGLLPGAPIVATISRISPRKGHSTILRALCRLKSPVNWIVVGSGSFMRRMRPKLWRMVAPRRVRIRHFAEQPETELRRLMNLSDMMVLTPVQLRTSEGLDSEGFGLVYLEANACGKPVIASDVAGCRDAVIDGETGLLVPPSNWGALCDAIRRLIGDPDYGRALGSAGRERVLALRGAGAAADEIVRHYRALSGE